MKYLLTVLVLIFGIQSTVHAAAKKSSKRGGHRNIASDTGKHKNDKKKSKAHHKKKKHGMNNHASQKDQFSV